MDTSTNRFHEVTEKVERKIEEDPARWRLFSIGQEIVIEGWRYRVRKVTAKDLVLRPVVRAERKE
jgi:hypothetical protein